MEIVKEIAALNSTIGREGRKYILIGPGRWGSADSWLGIPVSWVDISSVGGIVEYTHPLITADPSYGSHFFHNIASLGISYLTVGSTPQDRIDWEWLNRQQREQETAHLLHIRLPGPVRILVDGQSRKGALIG